MRRRSSVLAAAAALALAWGPSRAQEADPDAVRRAVDEVFADPALREGLGASDSGDATTAIAAWLARQYEAFQDWLAALWATSPALFMAIMGVLLVVLAGLLTHIGWTLSLAFRRVPGEGDADGDADRQAEEARVRHYRTLRADAHALADAGDFREAARTLLLALLALVEEQHALTVVRGWTNREILRRIPVAPAVEDELGAFGAAVERVWYGRQPTTRDEIDALDRTLTRVAAHLQPGSGAA